MSYNLVFFVDFDCIVRQENGGVKSAINIYETKTKYGCFFGFNELTIFFINIFLFSYHIWL